ncbi:MAG: hypothetical protein O3C40_35745 [Planctomycetota bacterium]|nr:hypothetical protein [Planctomycetota bacterium]
MRKIGWQLAFCLVLAGVPCFCTCDGAAEADGFALLLRAAKEAPEPTPKPDAPISELKEYVERGESAWRLCVSAVDAKIEVPVSVESSAINSLRPFLRMAQQRAYYGLQSDDPAMTLDVFRVLIEIGKAFNTDAHLIQREGGFLADIYLTGVLANAAGDFDQASCQQATQLIEEYIRNWEPAEPIVKRTVEQDRRQQGDQAVVIQTAAGTYGGHQKYLAGRLKLQETIYRLAIVKLQVRRFELQVGRLPVSLDELDDIDTADPYEPNKSPFRYSADASTYTLYSVGPDGTDDGGKSPNFAELLSGGSGDLAF